MKQSLKQSLVVVPGSNPGRRLLFGLVGLCPKVARSFGIILVQMATLLEVVGPNETVFNEILSLPLVDRGCVYIFFAFCPWIRG